jgi:hypothetical protein
MRRAGRLPAALAIAALAAVLGAGVALAGENVKQKTKTTSVAGVSQGFVTAKCKRGTRVVSGGFETEYDTISADPNVLINESHRAGRRSWTSGAFNLAASPSGDLTSFAYCRDQKLKRRHKAITVEQNEEATVTAVCPKGTKVFSGGFEAEPLSAGPFFYIRSSRKAGARKWEVSAINFGDPGELEADAYCRAGKKLKTASATDTVSRSSFPVNVYAAPQAECPRGRASVSGGFEIDGLASIRDSAKIGNDWRIAATANPTMLPFPTIPVTVFAYCEKKKPKQ